MYVRKQIERMFMKNEKILSYKVNKNDLEEFKNISANINSLITLQKLLVTPELSEEEASNITIKIAQDKRAHILRLQNWWTNQVIKNFIVTYEDKYLLVDFSKEAILYSDHSHNHI